MAITSEPARRISSFNSPTALRRPEARNELLQTSSAKSGLEWAGVSRSGFISINVTSTPRRAACHAASQPARPAPITVSWFAGKGSIIAAAG